jgi:hypothetical protein
MGRGNEKDGYEIMIPDIRGSGARKSSATPSTRLESAMICVLVHSRIENELGGRQAVQYRFTAVMESVGSGSPV